MPAGDQPPTPAVERRQCNVRLPSDLIDSMDERRARKDLSRDKFIERCVRYAMANHPELTTTRQP